MSKLRIGLIGYGSWTRKAYLPALQTLGRAEIVSAAAPSEKTRQRIYSELGNKLSVFDSYEALLNGPRLDGVMIAVPDTMHAAALAAALDSGIPAFYEPPLTHTRHHILPMLGRLLAAPQVTFADLELGFIPAVRRAAELVQSGTLGQVQVVNLRLQAYWGAEPENDLSTIGRLTAWYVDVLNIILGASPRRVFVQDGRGNAGRAQNYSLALLDYGDTWARFQVNIASVGELKVTLAGHGSAGEFELDLFTGEIRYRSRGNRAWAVEQLPAQTPYAGWPGMHESVAAFLEAVEKGEAGSNSARKMAQLNLVALAAEQAKDTGAWANVRDVSTIEKPGSQKIAGGEISVSVAASSGAVISLREITAETVVPICKLSDTLSPAQQKMVAPNALSIAQAHFSNAAWFRAIYADETPVGFMMLYDSAEETEYFLWRLMIAGPYQGLGYGKKAIQLLIEYVRTRPGAKELLVSCGEGESSPEGFYAGLGFQRTGEMEDNEVVMRLALT